jgi:uncharacterized protein YbjQ (UPF0145 family)
MVSGEAVADSRSPDALLLARARREALNRLVSESAARGAHGVVGLSQDLVALDSGFLVSLVGTAVTLHHRR